MEGLNLRRILICAAAVLHIGISATICAAQRDRSFFSGMWVDSTLYNEMQRTRSLYGSRDIILDQVVLEFHADTTSLHAFSDGIWYTDSVLIGDTLILTGPYTVSPLALYALDDSTISCVDCNYDSNLVFRKLSSQAPTPTSSFLDIELGLFEARIFVGNWKLWNSLTGKMYSIELTSERSVIGYGEWREFAVGLADIEGLPEFDNMLFADSLGRKSHFVFEVSQDSIAIYDLLRADGKQITEQDFWDRRDFHYRRGLLHFVLTRN